jgi:uncharacterized Ntn-hydrolase superfamily protein
MTYSILVHDPVTGAFGAAVASRFFAVGALCTHADGRVGALSTQALVNPMYGPDGMALLRQGLSAQEVVDRLVSPDPGRDQRQLHVIDSQARVAQHTGAGCVTWAGQVFGTGVSVAGNMLAGPAVLEAMLAGYAGATGPLALRLIVALQAGEDAGGKARACGCIRTTPIRTWTSGPTTIPTRWGSCGGCIASARSGLRRSGR